MSKGLEQPPLMGETNVIPPEAVKLCEDIERARYLMEKAVTLNQLAQRATNSVITETYIHDSNRIRVDLPEDAKACVSVDQKVTIKHPKTFIATEVRYMGEHGAEFYNTATGEWLMIKDLNFNVSPLGLESKIEE